MTLSKNQRMIVNGSPVPFEQGDSILIAMLRAGLHPTGGGCLCLGGDCNHCVATVDGVSYVRTCQTTAKPGLIVNNHPADGYPDLDFSVGHGAEVDARNLHYDVVVIGQGESGRAAAAEAEAAGKSVITLDAGEGQEVVGIYYGPMVVARTEKGMLHIHVHDEIIVATGAAEIQPVAPGSHLSGLVTARAATAMAAAGLDLGHVVAVGTPPAGVDVERAAGQLVRFEGEREVEAVVVVDGEGNESRYPCDTVSLGLGLHPRDALKRMGHDLPVRAVGDAALESDIPPCPKAGIVCPCAGVSVADLEFIWEQGFEELELVKRATLAGTGTCQGSACLPYIRSFLAEKGEELQKPFTARPVTKQLTIAEVTAGAHHHATPRTPLDREHRRLGAQMERIGGWWRPWNYGDVEAEYWSIREGVSIGDVSTLGKMIVTGPDALELLERLYPTTISTIRPGRSKYVLILNEKGYVLDDGLVCNDGDNRYLLTFTSGGSTMAELWVRDWAEAWGLDVRIMNRTMSLGAINVTGPLATVLMERAGLDKRMRYMRHRQIEIAGVDCRVYRLSFTGEIAYELHHPVTESIKLWRGLLELGADLGIRPHGLDALLKCRLEKGHVIVGQDTDFDSTPRRIHHEWAVKLEKPEFIGRHAVIRTNKVPLDKQLVGFEMEGPAPIEGDVVWNHGEYAGYVTSSTYSYMLGKSVMLGWLYLFDGKLPETVTIGGRTATRVPSHFYDSEGGRARA